MSTQQFAKGDTVIILPTHPAVTLHGKTGEVLGRTDCSARYVRVQVRYGRVELLLDSELELTNTEETK